MAVTEASHYIYDQAWQDEKTRITSLAAIFDPGTERLLSALGIAEGWSCLEVGGGAGTTAAWMADVVGAAGHVVATDLDTRFLDELKQPNIEVRRHDIVTDDIEVAAYDLVHARCLLEHLQAPDKAFERMLSALKPGGWVLAEDVDFGGPMIAVMVKYVAAPDRDVFAKTINAFDKLFEAGGSDGQFGSKLPELFARHGLKDPDFELRALRLAGGSQKSDFGRLSLEQMRDLMIQMNLMTQDEITQALANIADPARATISVPLLACWGRSP